MKTRLLNPSPSVGMEYRLTYTNYIMRDTILCEETYSAKVILINGGWIVDETLTIHTVTTI